MYTPIRNSSFQNDSSDLTQRLQSGLTPASLCLASVAGGSSNIRRVLSLSEESKECAPGKTSQIQVYGL